MDDNMEYIKCGEILKLKSSDYKDQYILKCSQCDEYYCLLESFVFHCASHWKETFDEKSTISELNEIYNEAVESLRNEVAEIENLTKKYEDEMESLALIKYEPVFESEKLNVKEEYATCEPEEYENHDYEVVYESLEEEQQLSDNADDANEENNESENECMDSEESNYPIFVKSFMKSKLSVTTLISAYKNQPYLWNTNFPQFTIKEHRQKSLQLIRKELNNKLHLQITCNHVAEVLAHLCRKYLEGLKYSKINDQQEEKRNEPAWFFEHLKFLEPFVDNDSLTKFECQPILGPKQIIKILAIYEKFPHLWNTDLIENVCRNKRLESLGHMQVVIESELGLKLSENALKKNIQFIHNHFAKIKRFNPNSDKTTNGRSIYYKHMRYLYDHVGPFNCSDCGQEFKSPLAYKVHKSEHDGLNGLKCSLCDKEYTKAGPYIAHARRHMDDLNEECKECGKKFLVACELRIHMRCHSGAKPYCCEICGLSFRHSNALTGHRRRHQKQYLHNCPICSKGYYTKDRMNDHIRSHNNIRDFVCKTCGKAFITKKTLQQHEITHGDVRKHVCALCGKSFKLKVGLNQHMRTHGGQI